jgi:tetratricopeptide (TPR) repeat protein
MPIIELPDIVQSLQNKQWTGTLEVLSGEDRRSFLFFRSGMIMHCKMDRSQVVLGRALFELQLIDELDYNLTLFDYEQTGRRAGEVLLELGLVDEAAIRKALAHQGRENVLEAFTWSNLDAKFHPDETPLTEVFTAADREVPLNISGMGILMEAARRADEWGMIQDVLKSEHDVLAPLSPEGLPPGLIDRRIHLLIDSYRSAYEIAGQAPLETLVALQSLATLVRDGHLKCLEPTELAKIGVTAEQDGEYAKALHVYELAASRGLEHLDLYRRIARACQLLGRTKEALGRWLDVAQRCMEVDRKDLAVSALREACGLDPEDIQLGLRLADLLVETEDVAGAVEHLRVLVAQAEDDEDAPEKTIALMDKLLDLAPEDLEILERVAKLHLRTKDKIMAMARYDEMATVLITVERHQEAVDAFYTILDIDNENLEARLRLAKTLADMGSTDGAVREYQRLADILYRSGLISNAINWDFLIRVYESIVELDSSSTAAWDWLAKAYLENGNLEKAISRYLGMADSLEPTDDEPPPPQILQPLRRVIEIDPERRDIRERLATTHLTLNQVDRAVRCYRELAEWALDATTPDGRQVDLAREAYNRALGVSPFDMDSRRGLAEIHELLGETQEAQAAWRAIGGLCLRAGLFDDASQGFHRAIKLNGADTDSLLECACSEQLRGKAQNAGKLYSRYAELMVAQQNLGLAREALEQAVKLDPGNAQAMALMAQVGSST